MMAQAASPIVTMGNQHYPPCEPVCTGICLFACCCPCIAAKDNWEVLERLYDPRDRGQQRQADNVCMITCLLCLSGFECIGLWWQREKLAKEMGFTPPSPLLDIVCSWCCSCCTLEQDREAIDLFRAQYSKMQVAGMGNLQNLMHQQMLNQQMLNERLHLSQQMVAAPAAYSYPVGAGAREFGYSQPMSPRGGGTNRPYSCRAPRKY